MRAARFEYARQFLGGYLHQDWPVEFAGPEVAVRKYIQDAYATERSETVGELRQLLAETEDRELPEAVFRLGCYYLPPAGTGAALRGWLERIIGEIERSVVPSPALPNP